MFLSNPFANFAFGEIFDTVLPDFVLSFTFFTAITYAVLGKRFGQQRPAVAMSAALGMALSIGFVWWEHSKGISIRNLGPIAVGFAVIMLAGVIYQSIRGVGGCRSSTSSQYWFLTTEDTASCIPISRCRSTTA